MKEIQKKLPEFVEPKNLSEAKVIINNLGRNMAEHAYIIGKILVWIKEQLKHGEFIEWIEKNVWFKKRTAQNFMAFSEKCDEEGLLIDSPHYLEKDKNAKFALLESPPLPKGKYPVIYADPPWPVDSMLLEKWESPIGDKYLTMTIEEIKILGLKISECTADDCSLFLWTTHTFLKEAFDVIESWGFKYHCCITWDKISGWSLCGFHRKTEFCLYAYKGKINITQTGEYIPTLISEPKRKHSKKPEIMYKLIEDHAPFPRLELFAREKRDGWISWGDEV